MSLFEAIALVLQEAGSPLPHREITERILQKQLWSTNGATPDAIVHAKLATDIKERGTSSHFQRVAKGVFALRIWGLPDYNDNDSIENTHKPNISPSSRTYSFTEAAQKVLEQYGNHESMHYRDIT